MTFSPHTIIWSQRSYTTRKPFLERPLGQNSQFFKLFVQALQGCLFSHFILSFLKMPKSYLVLIFLTVHICLSTTQPQDVRANLQIWLANGKHHRKSKSLGLLTRGLLRSTNSQSIQDSEQNCLSAQFTLMILYLGLAADCTSALMPSLLASWRAGMRIRVTFLSYSEMLWDHVQTSNFARNGTVRRRRFSGGR